MKRIILSLSILLFSFSGLFAQTLYTRTDTLAITTDSVTLQAGSFRGAIQWQRSIDGKSWENLSGKTGKALNVYKNNEGFYRAEITDDSCNPVYSDTAIIQMNLATVDSIIISNITGTSVICNVNIKNDGRVTVKARGVCWNTTGSPTIADRKTTSYNGEKSFTSFISGLTAKTTYYVRAYATTNTATYYSNQVSFSTNDSITAEVNNLSGNWSCSAGVIAISHLDGDVSFTNNNGTWSHNGIGSYVSSNKINGNMTRITLGNGCVSTATYVWEIIDNNHIHAIATFVSGICDVAHPGLITDEIMVRR